MATKTTNVVFKQHDPQSVADLSGVAGDPLIAQRAFKLKKTTFLGAPRLKMTPHRRFGGSNVAEIFIFLTLKVYSHHQWGDSWCQWGYFWRIFKNHFWKNPYNFQFRFSKKKCWFFTTPFFKGKVDFDFFGKYVFLFTSGVFSKKKTTY